MSLTSDKCRWDIDIRQFADDNVNFAYRLDHVSLTSDKCRWDIDIRQFADDNVNSPIG